MTSLTSDQKKEAVTEVIAEYLKKFASPAQISNVVSQAKTGDIAPALREHFLTFLTGYIDTELLESYNK